MSSTVHNMKTHAKKVLLSLLLVAATAAAGWCANDLLEIPALETAKADRSMLVDITLVGERLFAAGERGHIIYSDDHGKSWTQAQVPVSVTITAMSFPTPQTGWAVGHDSVVLHTTDGGQSWSQQIKADDVNQRLLEGVEKIIEAKRLLVDNASEADRPDLEFELEDAEFFLSDAELAVQEGPTRPFMDVWFANEREGVIVGAFGMIFRTEDGGENWEPILDKIDNSQGYHYYSLSNTKNALLLVGEMGMIFRSTDEGRSWERVESPYEGSFFAVAGDPASDYGVAVGLRGNMAVTRDAGQSWELVPSVLGATLNGVTMTSAGEVYMVGFPPAAVTAQMQTTKFGIKPIGFQGSMDVAQAADGHLVTVGLGGVQHINGSAQGE